MVIGLTGGIGCGKSAALAAFARLGFHVVDADQLAKTVLVRPDVIAQLVARWGRVCLGPDGLPNRAWIARKVFGMPEELTFLEGILHPEVARLRQAAVVDSTQHHVVEIPLLFEKSLQAEYDCVICVACSDEARLARLEAKGISRADAMARIESQIPVSQKVAKSNYVFWNDGELAALNEQVERFVRSLAPLAKQVI